MNPMVAIRRASGKRSLIAATEYDPAKHTLWEDDYAMQQAQEKDEKEITPKRRGRPRRG